MRLPISKWKSCLIITVLILLLSTLLGCSFIAVNSTPVVDGQPDTSKYVKLSMLLMGPSSTEAIEGYRYMVEELNNNVKTKINTNVEVTFIPFQEAGTEYPLIFSSKESYDIIYTGDQGQPGYFSLAANEIFMPLDELLSIYAKDIWAKTDVDRWDDVKYDGRIYGVPFGRDEYRCNGYIYRGDLLQKYEMEPIVSLDSMESYMDTILIQDPELTPIEMDERQAIKLYDMLIDLHQTWIPAPGLPQSSLYIVAKSKDNITDILHPAFSSEFMDFAEKMKEWADKQYWGEDVLMESSSGHWDILKVASIFDNLSGHVDGSVGLGSSEDQTDYDIKFYCFGEDNNKIIKYGAAKNVLGISAKSGNGERALMLLDYIIGNKDYYELLSYGFEGPIIFDTDLGDMAEHYKNIALDDPYGKFDFDSSSAAEIIEDLQRVNSQYGIPILLGKAGDPRTAVNRYREELTKAGIQSLLDTIKAQLDDH